MRILSVTLLLGLAACGAKAPYIANIQCSDVAIPMPASRPQTVQVPGYGGAPFVLMSGYSALFESNGSANTAVALDGHLNTQFSASANLRSEMEAFDPGGRSVVVTSDVHGRTVQVSVVDNGNTQTISVNTSCYFDAGE